MKIPMISAGRALCLAVGDDEYRPDDNGVFQIDEKYEQQARAHGFIKPGELAPRRSIKEQNTELVAENARLKAQLEAKNGKAK